MTNLDQIHVDHYPVANCTRMCVAHVTRDIALAASPVWLWLMFASPSITEILDAFMEVAHTSWLSALTVAAIALTLKSIPGYFIGAIVVTSLSQAGHDVRDWCGIVPWLAETLWRKLRRSGK